MPGGWWPFVYQSLFQLDDEPYHYIKHWKSPFPSIEKKLSCFFWVPGSNLRLPASYGFVPLDLDLVIVGDAVCPIRLVNHHFSPRNFRLQIQANMTNMTNMSCFMSPPYAVYSSAGSQWFPAVALLNHMLVYGPFPDRRSHWPGWMWTGEEIEFWKNWYPKRTYFIVWYICLPLMVVCLGYM